MGNYFDVLVFLLTGVVFIFFGLWVASLFRPHRPDAEKLSIYECGVRPFGDSRAKFRVRYYYKELGLFGLTEMLVFLGVLVIGLIYAWKKKVLQWV